MIDHKVENSRDRQQNKAYNHVYFHLKLDILTLSHCFSILINQLAKII